MKEEQSKEKELKLEFKEEELEENEHVELKWKENEHVELKVKEIEKAPSDSKNRSLLKEVIARKRTASKAKAEAGRQEPQDRREPAETTGNDRSETRRKGEKSKASLGKKERERRWRRKCQRRRRKWLLQLS